MIFFQQIFSFFHFFGWGEKKFGKFLQNFHYHKFFYFIFKIKTPINCLTLRVSPSIKFDEIFILKKSHDTQWVSQEKKWYEDVSKEDRLFAKGEGTIDTSACRPMNLEQSFFESRGRKALPKNCLPLHNKGCVTWWPCHLHF